jgi:hypothetical protein
VYSGIKNARGVGLGESTYDREGGNGRRRGMDPRTRLGVSVYLREDDREMAGEGD